MASIFIFEDDLTTRALLRRWLSNMGHEVLEAHNGTDARTIFSVFELDLIITDLLMPEGDGVEVLREIHKLERKPKCMVISGATEFLDVLLDMGADAIMAKPLTKEGLTVEISNLLKN